MPSNSGTSGAPAGTASPTGRMPQERSRLPSHTAGSTTVSSPSTTSVPLHVPSWANRCASRVTREPARITCRCSRSASLVASQVRSIAMPSVSSSTTRSFRSGSATSTR